MSAHDPDTSPSATPEVEPVTSYAPPSATAPQFVASSEPLTGAVPAAPAPGAFCRACGNGIDQRAVICPQCGVATGHGQHAGTVVVSGSKSGGVAVLLSLLFTGAGHWYTGEVGRGFAFFGGAILAALSLAFLIGIVALPVVWIWAAIDANQSAERYNRRVASAAARARPLR